MGMECFEQSNFEFARSQRNPQRMINKSVERTSKSIKNTLRMEKELDNVKDLLVKMIEGDQYSGYDEDYFKSIIDTFTDMRINRITRNKKRIKRVCNLVKIVNKRANKRALKK